MIAYLHCRNNNDFGYFNDDLLQKISLATFQVVIPTLMQQKRVVGESHRIKKNFFFKVGNLTLINYT